MMPINTRLSVDYLDDHTARSHRVHMWIENGMLQLAGRQVMRQVPLSKVQWPDCHGLKLAHMANGGAIKGLDTPDWDNWLKQHNLGKPPASVPLSLRWTVLATCLLLTLTVMGYGSGLP